MGLILLCVFFTAFLVPHFFVRYFMTSLVADSKASAYNVGDPGSIPGLGRSPGEGNGNPLQYSCLEKSHGQRNLGGYSPWGRKESDTADFYAKGVGSYSRM